MPLKVEIAGNDVGEFLNSLNTFTAILGGALAARPPAPAAQTVDEAACSGGVIVTEAATVEAAPPQPESAGVDLVDDRPKKPRRAKSPPVIEGELTAPESKAPETKISVADVRAKLMQVVQEFGDDAAFELLHSETGAKRLSEVDPAKLPDLAAAIDAKLLEGK